MRRSNGMNITLRSFLSTLVVIAAIALFFTPPPMGAGVNTMHAAAVLLLAIGLWAVGTLPEHLTGLIFLVLCMLLAIAPAGVVFSGFASGTLWLVLGGLVIAEAVRATGLGERLATFLFSRITLSYERLIAVAVFISVVLGFVMPATVARVLLLLPIFAAVGARHGLRHGSQGQTGLALAAIIVSFQCGITVLPANAPNLVLAGAAETLYHKPLIYADYLLLHFPVLGVVKGVLIAWLVCRLFPATTTEATEAPHQPMSHEERRLTAILIAALALWATDFLHGIRPGWIALSAAIVILLPRVGAVPHTVFPAHIRLGSFFYVGAVLGFGAVMQDSGVGQAVGGRMLGVLDLHAGNDVVNFFKLALLGTFTGLLTTNPSQPALLAPLAMQMADATGWRLEAALMIIAVGFSTMILPYQAPPVMVGVQVAGIPLRSTLRLTLPLAAISIFVLLPLDYLWWWWLGYFR
jgi:anion transporter